MSQHETAEIHEFDIKSLPCNGFIQIIGKRGTGKTSWAKHICSNLEDSKNGIFIVMAGSEKVKESWSEYIPGLFVLDPSEMYLEKIKNIQNKNIKMFLSRKEEFPQDLHITLIMDDCSSNKAIIRSKIMAWFGSNGRHIELRVILLTQYLNQIIPELRCQFDVVVILATSNKKNVTKFHEEFVGCGNLRTFHTILNIMTEDNGALIVDNRTNPSSLSSCCFYGKINPWPIPAKRLGHPTTWEFNDKHFILQEEEEENITTKDNMDVEIDEEDDMGEISSRIELLGNEKRMYSDRHGSILVRKIPKKNVNY